jgi:hypothetical protein
MYESETQKLVRHRRVSPSGFATYLDVLHFSGTFVLSKAGQKLVRLALSY